MGRKKGRKTNALNSALLAKNHFIFAHSSSQRLRAQHNSKLYVNAILILMSSVALNQQCNTHGILEFYESAFVTFFSH